MENKAVTKPSLITLGWREWVSLPDLGIPAIKAKIDTGARTSALHAFRVEEFSENGVRKVRFDIHPLQKKKNIIVSGVAPIVDQRIVTDSGGHPEERYVIESILNISGKEWPVEITLTNRDTMRFRMLIGRTAMKDRAIVDPGASYVLGRELGKYYRKTKKKVGG